ncbi:winged helix-turn-helix domain-containing protein [Thalassotalea sp. ND16A]|uniref:winged helix-turn-helix domain-containing protein n=1 Tax=Thalassotalea sp. ND16A TaxID=1535422 RepID=UPI00051A51CF|nr:winged helix-turn-helix domain-containing protein [Thalassotalea sp. ND16A]KGJ99691.1 putative transcriptional regulator, CadC [Thalassotalea sp. ND16A]
MTEPDIEFVLDEWLIYPEKSAIKRNDEIIHLEPKIMEVLVYLLKNANKVVSREELTEQVWQSRFASDEVITRAISVLRKKLDDTGKVHRFIKTIPKHGYVLETNEQVIEHNDAVEHHREPEPVNALEIQVNRFIKPLTALLVAVFSIAIAVAIVSYQYFVDQRQQTADNNITLRIDDFTATDNLDSSAMVARVLTEQLLTTLSNSTVANVTLNSSIFDDISSTDNEFFISGAVKEINSEFHINLHFADSATGKILWSQSFAGEKANWHQLVSNVSQTIEFFFRVAHKEKLDLKTLSLKTLQASILIHQARELRFVGSVENFELAITILQNAVLTYPDEHQIITELALSYLRTRGDFFNADNLPYIKRLIDQAEQNNYHGGVYWLVKGLYQFKVDEIDLPTAISYLQKSQKQVPENVEVLTLLSNLHRVNGDAAKATELARKALQIEPEFSLAVFYLAKLESQRNNNVQAINLLTTYLKKYPNDYGLSHLLVKLYNGTGKFDKTINYLTNINLENQKERLKEYIADGYFFVGLTDKAIETYLQVDTISPTHQFQVQCMVLMLERKFVQASEACKLADKSKNPRGRFHYARNLMLQGKYEQAKNRYKQSFDTINADINAINLRSLIDEKVDYIWLLSQAGEMQQAQQLAAPLLARFKQSNRLGYLGYGISDVVILIALGQEQQAFEAFSVALDSGWLQWNHWLYSGPHPALERLKADPRYEQWHNYIQQALANQRVKISQPDNLVSR